MPWNRRFRRRRTQMADLERGGPSPNAGRGRNSQPTGAGSPVVHGVTTPHGFDAGKAVKRKISDIGLVAALDRNTKRLDELIRAGFKVHGSSTDIAVLLTQLKDTLKAVRESH